MRPGAEARLRALGASIKQVGAGHSLITFAGRAIDYWPRDGLWIPRGSGRRRYGLRNLIKHLMTLPRRIELHLIRYDDDRPDGVAIHTYRNDTHGVTLTRTWDGRAHFTDEYTIDARPGHHYLNYRALRADLAGLEQR